MGLSIQKICSQKSNRWLILIHGFLGSKKDWQKIIYYLPETWNYYLIDLPGHGDSTLPVSRTYYSMQWIAHELKKEILHLKPSRWGVLGYSMGGRVALHLAELCRNEIGFLILESASPGIENGQEKIQRRKWDDLQAGRIREAGMQQFLDEWYRLPVFTSLRTHPDFPNLVRERERNSAYKVSIAMKYLGTGRMKSFWPFLTQFTKNVFYIAGELDTKYVEIGKALSRHNRHIHLKIVKSAGHNVHFENRKEFVAIVTQILNQF
jgi:2-succinyl-6-hydroxy-2,4-cyclohexadiene-1-carboxylate synthase